MRHAGMGHFLMRGETRENPGISLRYLNLSPYTMVSEVGGVINDLPTPA